MVLRKLLLPYSMAHSLNPLPHLVVRQVVDAKPRQTLLDNRMKVLRTIYIPPRMDDKLAKMAKQMGVSRNALIEKCIILGMKLNVK